MLKRISFLFLSVFFLFMSCSKDDRLEEDKMTIEQYLSDNNLTATQVTDEGVYYLEDLAGSGQNPTSLSTVTVHYEGFLLDGTKFDSSIDRGSTAKFPLSDVIRGWQIGIPLMKKGGKGTLLIPSELAYGSSPPVGSIIPSNAILRFTVQLIDIE